MFIKDNLLFQLTTEEQGEVKAILSSFSEKFDTVLANYGVSDMAPFFCNLLGEMIDYSMGDQRKSPENFKAALKYHFKEEGDKFYAMTVKLFQEIFFRFQEKPVAIVKIAVQLKLMELLEKFKDDVKVENGALFFKRKRHI